MSLTLPAGITREPIDPRDAWIVDAQRNPVGVRRFDGTELYFEAPDKSYAGSPVGVLTPDFVGQEVQDTVAGVFYVATTPTSSGWAPTSSLARTAILSGASAGTSTSWLPISDAPERFAYQLDSGSTTTTFSVDVSADGSTSLGQAFTGTYASSSVAEITPPIMFSAPTAKYFRWNVLTGGPLSVSRGY